METIITPQPPNEIYSFLRDNKLTDKTEKDFLKEYENPEKAKDLHDFFIKNKLTTKNYDEFYDQYLKKKDSELPPEDGSSGGENSASSLLGSSLNPNNPNPVLQGLPNLRPQEPVEPAKEDKRKYIEKEGKYFLDNGDGKLNPITKITYDFGVKNAAKKSSPLKPFSEIELLNKEKDATTEQLQKAAEAYMFWEDAHKKMGEDFLKSQNTDPSNYLQAGKEKDKYLKTVQELERKKIDIQEKVSGLGVEWGIAPELLISKLEKPKETSYFQGTWKAFDQSGIDIVKSLEGALQLLEDAGTFVKTGGKGGFDGAKSGKPKLSDVMQENNKTWLDAPDNILGKTASGLGSMTYDLVLTGLAPEIKLAQLSKATGGGITQVPKFGTFMGAKGFGSSYSEDRDLMKAMEGGIMGFEDGVLMHSLGYTGHQIGNVLANAKKSPYLNKLAGATATSLIFGAHAGYESYLHEGKINWDDVGVGFGTGLAFGIIPIIKAARDRAVTHFMTTPNKTISTIIQAHLSAQELRETSIDLIEKAGEEAPGEKKQAAQLAAVISTTAADLIAISDEVLSNPQAFKDQIDATENLSAIEKQFYKDKIDRFVSENDERVIAAKPYLDEVKRLEGEAANVEAQNIDANVKELNKKAIETSIKEMKKAAEDAFMKAAEKKSEKKEEKKPDEKKPEDKPADKPEPKKPKTPTPSEIKKEIHSDFNEETKLNTTLIGSVSRGEAKEGSDIDIVLDGMPNVGKEKITQDEAKENSKYAYDTLKELEDKGVITELKLKAGGNMGVSFKYKGEEFQVVPNPHQSIEKPAKPKEKEGEEKGEGKKNEENETPIEEKKEDRYPVRVIFIEKIVADGENTPLTERQQNSIEKAVQMAIDAAQKPEQIMATLNALGYAFRNPQNMAGATKSLKSYLEDRIAGKTKRTITEFAKDTRAADQSMPDEKVKPVEKVDGEEKPKSPDKPKEEKPAGGKPKEEKPKAPAKPKEEAPEDVVPEEVEREEDLELDDLLSGAAQKRRNAGEYVKDGVVYKRNEVQDGPKGNKGTVLFADGVSMPFQYQLVDADNLQPSHTGSGFRNPNFFIVEAQPKNRTDKASIIQSDKIAANPDFKQVSENAVAYFGAPVVNNRGEVIQGNNRSIGLKKHYGQAGEKYKTDLAENAEKFGFTKEQVQGMKKPVLVRTLEATDDATAIRLGNYDVKDLETGGQRRIDPVTTSRKMPQSVKGEIMRMLFQEEGITTKAAIREKIEPLKAKLVPYLTKPQMDAIFRKDGELKPEGMDDLEKLIQYFLFDGGNNNLPDMFESLRGNARDGLNKALPHIFSVPKAKSILPEIQNAILAAADFKKSGVTDFGEWTIQKSMFAEATPFEIYTPTELAVAKLLSEGATPKEIKTVFQTYEEHANGKIGDAFEEPVEAKTKKEAIKETFKTDYDEKPKQAKKPSPEPKDKPGDQRIDAEEGDNKDGGVQEGPPARPGEPLDQGGGGKGNAGRRPTIVKANAEFIPKPKYELPKDEYTMLDDEQRLGVQLAMDRFISGAKGFINADGTGVGKTMQQIVIAKEYQKHFKKPVVIITENENIIDNNFKGDAKLLGVDISDIEFGTYTQLGKGKVAQGKYGLVIFDEAHNLKNAETAKASEAANIKTDQKLFVTATPMDKVPGAIYFVKETTNLTESQIIDKLGFSILEERDPQTGKITYKAVIKEGTNPADINRNVAKLSQEMTQEGAMIRREYPFFGEISESKIELTEEQADEQSEILDYWEDQLEEAKNENGGISPAAAMSIGGQRSGELSRWNESNKLSLAYKKTVDNIKAGRKVVIIAEGVNPSFIKGLNREVPGIITELVKKLEAAGYKVGKIYGGDQAKNKEANDKFQAGELDVVIGTPKSASTGRNLDDSVGNAPRTLLMVTANYSGEQFQQILGRVSRRNTKTPAKIEILYNNSAIDLRRMEIVSNKLRTLKAIQEGRIDEVDIGLQDVGENKKPDVAYGDITIVQYSEKAILVKGVPKSLAPMIKTLGRGGKWNWKLAGWIFSNDSRPAVEAFLERMNKKEDGEGGPIQSKGAEGKISDFEKRPPVKPSEPFKLFDRVYELVKKYAPNSKLLQGYQGKNALGSFHTLTKNLRLKGLNDIAVAFHEITHALDDAQGLIKNLPTDLKKRLYDVYLQYYPDAKPTHSAYLKSTEGYAMLMQKYVESPSLIEAEYPELVAELIKGKHAFKEMDEFLIDASNLISDYQNLEPMDKFGARMVNEIKKDARKLVEKAKSFKDRLEAEIFDDLQALEEMDNKSGTLFTADDVTSQIRMARNSDMYATNNLDGKKYLALNKAGEYVEKHNFTWKTISDQIIDKVGSDGIERVGEYMYAREVKSWYDAVNKLNAEIEALDNKIAGETDQAIIDVLNAERLGKMKKRQEIVSIINNEGVSEMEANEAYDKGKEMFSFIEDKINTLMREQILLLANDNVRIIDNDQKKQYLSRNGEYAPLKRAWYNEVIGDVSDESMHLKPVSGGMGSLKKRYGSKKPVINPFLSAMANEAVFTRKAHEAMVKNKIYDNVMKYPAEMGNYFEPIALTAIPGKQGIKGFAESSDPTVLIAKDRAGTTKGLKILDPAVARVLSEEFSYKDIPIVLKAMVEASRLFKIGTTGWFPPFLVANTTLDAVSRFTNTRTGLIPFASEASELTKALNNKNSMERKYWREYLYLAGKTQTRMGWNKVAVNEGSIGKIEKRRRVAMVANGMSNISDFLSAPSNISEVLPRATEYIRARKQGKTQAVALELAGRVTGPFHHKGRMTGVGGQAWVKAVPYMNPILQVLDVTMERLKTKEGAERYVAASAMLGAAAGATIYTVMNVWSDEEREKAMNELKGKSPQELAMYLYVPHPYKRGEFLKIRTPETHSYISLGVNMYFLEKYAQANYTKGEMFDAATTPIPDQLQPWKGLKWLMSVTPNMVRNPLEIGFNTQTFPTVRPIESEYERRNMLPENRYNAYTSDFAKYLAKTDLGRDLQLSPKMIDHFIKGNLGRATGYITGKPGMFNLEKIFVSEMYLESTRQARQFFEKTKLYEQYVHDAKAEIRKATGASGLSNYEMLSVYDEYVKGIPIDKKQMEEVVNYLEQGQLIEEKLAELKNLDPDTDQKGFEQLSNEIMQDMVNLNDKGTVE